jgi:hypothetical protein
MTSQPAFRIFVGEIPYSETDTFWVSFESDPHLKKTRDNIYGRCLPCIQNLYRQLQEGRSAITLGTAYQCWKVTAVVSGVEECLALLAEYETCAPREHVHGKFGSGNPELKTKVVVFHADHEAERDRIAALLHRVMPRVDAKGRVIVSRACAILYEGILGDWREWQPITPIRHPEKVHDLMDQIKKTLFWSVM